MDFVIGGLAGAGATIVSNPMDVVKTRLQLQGELRARNAHVPRYNNILHAMYTIGKVDGAVALQSGLVPAMVLGFTLNSVRLGLYHVAEVQGWTLNKGGDVNINKALFWSCISGAMSGVAANPAFVIKTRIQAASHPSIAVGRQYTYNGTWDAIRQIYKKEGIKGYCAGMNATCTRLAIGSAAQLTTFSAVKEYLERRGYFENSPVQRAFYASIMSTLVIVVIETPLDVANTRLYNQGTDKSAILYKGVIDCLTKIYKTEGLHGFYKGLAPLYLRMAPHTTLSLVIWDMLNIIMKEK